MKNRVRMKNKKLLWRICAVILTVVVVISFKSIRLNPTGLILLEGKDFVLYPEKDKRIILDGLLGQMAVSDTGKKGVYLQLTSDNQVQIVEIDLKTYKITPLVTPNQLEMGMKEAGEADFTAAVEGRPISVKFVKGTNAVSFIWENSIYIMDLEKGKVQCILKNFEQSPLAVEGMDYEWIDENNFVYVTIDKFNSIFQYNLLTNERQFVHYGSGVCSYDNERIVCYHEYIRDSTTWIHYHEFSIINMKPLEEESVFTYKLDETISKYVAHAIFDINGNGIIAWGEENDNRLYFCNYPNKITWIKFLPGRKVHSILLSLQDK